MGLAPMVAVASIFGFFTYLTPILIHYVSKKYVSSIVYNPQTEEYTATVFNFIPTLREVCYAVFFIVGLVVFNTFLFVLL